MCGKGLGRVKGREAVRMNFKDFYERVLKGCKKDYVACVLSVACCVLVWIVSLTYVLAFIDGILFTWINFKGLIMFPFLGTLLIPAWVLGGER